MSTLSTGEGSSFSVILDDHRRKVIKPGEHKFITWEDLVHYLEDVTEETIVGFGVGENGFRVHTEEK
jgi:hypothetical protein